ncbi:MAG: hypothetical protein OXH52_08255, partial [Gammaproteobacteria bacterium]|nr:hypothetical protein [Gammaproteobacteria bacterium]
MSAFRRRRLSAALSPPRTDRSASVLRSFAAFAVVLLLSAGAAPPALAQSPADAEPAQDEPTLNMSFSLELAAPPARAADEPIFFSSAGDDDEEEPFVKPAPQLVSTARYGIVGEVGGGVWVLQVEHRGLIPAKTDFSVALRQTLGQPGITVSVQGTDTNRWTYTLDGSKLAQDGTTYYINWEVKFIPNPDASFTEKRVTSRIVDNRIRYNDGTVWVGPLAQPQTWTLVNLQSETRGLSLSRRSLTIAEADTAGTAAEEHKATYTAALRGKPVWFTCAVGGGSCALVTGTTTVRIGSLNTGAATVSPASLTFTHQNWSVPQTVTVTGVDDNVANVLGERAASILHSPQRWRQGDHNGSDYDTAVMPNIAVAVTDDDVAAVVLTPAALTVAEGDDSEYTVKLASEPTASVTVTIAGHADTDLTPSPTSLTFTTSNWATAQTVTVSADEDDDAVNDTETLTHTAAGGNYASVKASMPVTVSDDETTTPRIVVPASLSVAEGGEASYTVRLGKAPTATVTVAIAGHADTDLTPDPTTLTFTTSNWATAQTVTVDAGEDNDAVDDTATLTHTASGGDYADVTAALTVNTADDEDAALVVPRSVTVTEGSTASYEVKLASQPYGGVEVTISGHAGTAVTPSPTTLSFSNLNWDTAQTVTLTAAEDDDASDVEVTLAHEAEGGGYRDITADVTVTVDDDETAEIVLSRETLSVDEGSDAEYTVKLGSKPSANVTVTLTGHADTDLTPDPATLTFTTTNWGTAQTVTVSADEDDDAANDPVTLTHTAAGGDYAALTASLPVTVTDDETAEIVLSKATLAVDEGDDA